MSSLPSRPKALRTLRKFGCSEDVIRHSVVVADVAIEIASCINPKANVDLRLIEIGALLHDIGRSATHGVKHGSIGAEILERLSYPSSLVKIALNHVGAGIPREEAIALGLPPIDHMPTTVEEKLVCYADKLVRGSVRTSLEEALQALARDLGPKHPSLSRLQALHQEIMELTGGACDGTRSSREGSSGKK